jgi:hypothetical protein
MSFIHAAIRSGLPIMAAAATMIGCASSSRNAAEALWSFDDRPAPNLALGPSPDHNLLAREFVGRSAWPSADAGFEIENETYFSTFSYDDQSFYDRYSGGYSRQSVSERHGVIVR